MKDFTPRQARRAAAIWLAVYLVSMVMLPEAAASEPAARDKARAVYAWATLPVCRGGQTEGCRMPARCETDSECAELNDNDDNNGSNES